MGGKGALNYLPILPKAFIYVPKVMHKPVMGGNTMSETFRHIYYSPEVWVTKFHKLAQAANLERDG